MGNMDHTELLFFDTFSHDISEEINLDLVQFPKPVYISEVRIIPLGARVQADFPGGVRLGATNPSQFEIEFFVNDLSKPGASTFESLGGLEYKQNVNIQLECEKKHLPTDGLVLRGWYTTITLAVYGSLTKSLTNPPEVQPPIQPPAATVSTPQKEEDTPNVQKQTSEQEQDQWCFENQSHAQATNESSPTVTAPSPPMRTTPSIDRTRTPSAEPPKQETTPQKQQQQTQQQLKEDSLPPTQNKLQKRPTTPPTESLVSLSPESISAEEEEADREEDDTLTAEPFEPILSDEDMVDDAQPQSSDDIEFDCDSIQADELYVISPPELLDFEGYDSLFLDDKLSDKCIEKLRDIMRSLAKSVLNFNNASGQEKELFVLNCENLCSNLGNFELTEKDYSDLYIIVDAGLNVEFACSHPQPAYKVRHVKVGVRLADALCRLNSGPDILLNVNAPYKLLSLCMLENVALPVKLAAIRCVDTSLISPKIVEEFLKIENELYKLCLLMLDTAKLARLKYALSSLLRKIHIYESLSELRELTELEILELKNSYAFSTTLMAQPKRQLPASSQIEFDREQSRNPKKHLIVYFDHWKLLNRLLLVLCSPDSDHNLIKECRKFISLLSDSKEGLLYMLKESEVTKEILKVLKYNEPNSLGLCIAWRLQVTSCLISMFNDANDWNPLRRLHSFLIYPEGLKAVVDIIPVDDFIDIIMPCLSNNDHCEFAAEILKFVIQCSNQVHVFQYRASNLLDKSRNISILREVVPHLNVAATKSNWNYNDVSSLVAIVKKNADKASSCPGELLTACRILYYLVFPTKNDVDPMELYIELKHKNALTQVFATDGLPALVAVLSNVVQFFEQPCLHYSSLSGQRKLALISLLTPCVAIIKIIIEHLVKCMSTVFKDLTAIVPLVGVYCLVESIPKSKETKFLLKEIIDTLLIFTQAVDSDSSGNVAKSLWTQMLGEVLNIIPSNPCKFVPGLKLLSKLLPTILTSSDVFVADKSRLIGIRKLWSAHLQAQATSLTETLRLVSSSWNLQVLTLVSLVCKQLSDLAAPTALLVGRCLLDGILSSSPIENKLPILTLLNDLLKHAPMKATILTLTSPVSRAQVKSDQKYPPVIEMMCISLKSTTNIDVQKETLNIFYTLCNHKLSLMQESSEVFEKQLTHSVPSKEPLLVIIAILIELLATASKYESEIIQKSLQILLLLTSHNYGLYHVKSCLENKPDALKLFLEYVAKEQVEKQNSENLAKHTINFLDSLILCKSPERTLFLRLSQLSNLLCWEKSNGHPLEKIPEAASIVESFQTIEEKEDKESIPEMLEPLLPTPEALLNQFAQRSILPSEIAKNRDVKKYLKELPNGNNIDLLALATELLPSDFNLITETQKVCSKVPLHCMNSHVQNHTDQGQQEVQKQIIAPASKIKQPFVTPMRGRNQYSNSLRGNASALGVGRGADPFRSRPPNTSRPPSLHVDDFVALETCGAQPTGPTGYNKISIRGTGPSRVLAGSRSRPWVPERAPYLR